MSVKRNNEETDGLHQASVIYSPNRVCEVKLVDQVNKSSGNLNPWGSISDEECAMLQMSQLVPYVPRVIDLEDDNTFDHLVSRKRYAGKFCKSPFVRDFDSGASGSVSKRIFDVKLPFMIDIHDFDPFSTVAEEFAAFVEDGLNKSKVATSLYNEDKYYVPMPYVYGSIHVDNKKFFYSLFFSGQTLIDTHLEVLFYYLRKKAKYGPSTVICFTTTNFAFNNFIFALYKRFAKKDSDVSVIPPKHVVEEYIRGFRCDANIAWHMIDCVLFPIFLKPRNAKIGHWVLGILTFSDWCIHVYDSLRGALNDSHVRQALLPYSILLPHFLERANFYVERGIEKPDMEIFSIHLVDDLPVQVGCDCGIFVVAFTEFFVNGKEITNESMDIEMLRLRYGSLLWDYGRKKQMDRAISDDESTGAYFKQKKRGRPKKLV